ncbi:MAG: tyrosine-type recombinase/integrase [Crocinitomix sp.]|nr:tyrosine-type recombinase/integrase [Crocinitomix sp.]
MKQLLIKSQHYIILLQSFQDWLQTMGYAQGTVETFPVHLREFFHYLEQRHVFHIRQIKQRHYDGFVTYLQVRTNKRNKGGGLSTSTINKTMQSVNTFAKYINQNGRFTLNITSRFLQNTQCVPNVLSEKEIRQIYEATFTPHRENAQAIGQRDRAILAVFYGCGLRKSEGSALNITDIDLLKRRLFVRNGKGNKQRYVPIAPKAAEDIKLYLEYGRYWFLEAQLQGLQGNNLLKKTNANASAFFLNQRGQRMNAFYDRFKYLKKYSRITTHFSTHTFRHSIATHLLQRGMQLEEIAQFLGHASLESTQLYTHIVEGQQPVEGRQPTNLNLNQ